MMLSLSLKELQSRFLSGTSLPSYLVQLSLRRMELMSRLNMFVTRVPHPRHGARKGVRLKI